MGRDEPPIRIAGTDLIHKITQLKAGAGGDIVTFGSPILVQTLTNARLVDEWQIMVHPVIVGDGRRLFEHLDGRTDFRLVGVDEFNGGAMMIIYATTSSGRPSRAASQSALRHSRAVPQEDPRAKRPASATAGRWLYPAANCQKSVAGGHVARAAGRRP